MQNSFPPILTYTSSYTPGPTRRRLWRGPKSSGRIGDDSVPAQRRDEERTVYLLYSALDRTYGRCRSKVEMSYFGSAVVLFGGPPFPPCQLSTTLLAVKGALSRASTAGHLPLLAG